MSQPVFFAVETGGTKIVWRIADAAGAVLDQGRFATGRPEAAVEALIEAAEEKLRKSKVSKVTKGKGKSS